MILSNKRKANPPNQNNSQQSFNGSISQPMANSTVNNSYMVENDQFFSDPYQNVHQNYNPSSQPPQSNNFFEMTSQFEVSTNNGRPPSATNFSANNYFNPTNQKNPNNAAQNYAAPQYYQPPGAPFQNPQPAPVPSQPSQIPNHFYNPMQANVNNLFNDPVASMAVKYGSTLADQGKEYVTQNVDRWFSISKLKYYFAVDTSYVTKKLFIILFPFFNRDWSIKYAHADSVPPKLEVNAPDMYIPVMAFVTYILMVGVCLGTQNKFTPEQLGIQASSALGWFVIEVFVIFISLQILGIKSALKTFDIMAFCGYKYFGMILCLAASVLISSSGYNIVLIYMCISFTYFMLKREIF